MRMFFASNVSIVLFAASAAIASTGHPAPCMSCHQDPVQSSSVAPAAFMLLFVAIFAIQMVFYCLHRRKARQGP